MYKIYKPLTLAYLRKSLPPSWKPLYGQIPANAYKHFLCRTSRFTNSFFPYPLPACNCITDDFQEYSSLSKFNLSVISLARSKPKLTIGIHGPTQLSSMNKYHKRYHNLLLQCPLFNLQRVTLLTRRYHNLLLQCPLFT